MWLIFATHDICENPSPFGCTAEFFENIVKCAIDSGARTLPVFQALEALHTQQRLEIKTWIADYASVEEIYWPVPGGAIDPAKLPSRAFDSELQKKQTLQLIIRDI